MLMSLYSRLALRWHIFRGCRLGDLGPYTDQSKKYCRCRVCDRVWPVPEW